MVAQTQARNINLTINGTNYSQYFVDLSVGWDSWRSGSGLRLKSGEIALTSITGGINLDPRDNDDFAPGNVVTISWNESPHPLAAKMLVLAPPTIEPLLSEVPAAGDNLLLKVSIGCTLSYYKAYEPDDDKSGVTLGTGTPSSSVITALLEAAGVPSGDIGAIAGLYDFDYPLQKQGGGFVDMAGEVAYCTAGTPGYLYCDRDNIVQSGALDLDGDSTCTIVLGQDDRAYEPQLDGRLPPGIVQAVGIRRRVITPAACTVTRYEEPDRIKQRFEVCKFESRDVIIAAYDRLTINRDPIIYSQFFNARYIYKRESTEEYSTVYNPNRTVRGQYWKQTGRVDEWQVYGGDLLRLVVKEQYAIRGQITELATISDYYQMEHSETTVTRYEYRADGTIKAVSEEQWLPRVIIAPTENGTLTSNSFVLVPATRKRTEWKREGTTWTERVSAEQARGIANPDFVESDENPGLTYYDLITTEESGTRISSTGNTVPPRADYWEPLSYEEEDQLQAEAKFSKSKQRAVLQVPYAFTTAQMQALAEAEGEITWGRAYQYLIECEPSIFSAEQTPHPIVRVRGAGENRTFLADAIQWQHTNSETWVGFAGIYLGGSGGTAGTGGSFSRASGIAPLVLVPTGATASGSTTPSGNPRRPLPYDGILMVGVDSTLREGTLSGLLVVE